VKLIVLYRLIKYLEQFERLITCNPNVDPIALHMHSNTLETKSVESIKRFTLWSLTTNSAFDQDSFWRTESLSVYTHWRSSTAKLKTFKNNKGTISSSSRNVRHLISIFIPAQPTSVMISNMTRMKKFARMLMETRKSILVWKYTERFIKFSFLIDTALLQL
jgi:hypothetical protein